MGVWKSSGKGSGTESGRGSERVLVGLKKILGEVLERGSGRDLGGARKVWEKIINVGISLDINQKMKSIP